MIGSLREYQQENATTQMPDTQGTAPDHDIPTPDTPPGTQPDASPPQPPGESAVKSGGASGAHPSTARHGTSWDLSEDGTDWQFCSQCMNLYEPGEYPRHFNDPAFDCAPPDTETDTDDGAG